MPSRTEKLVVSQFLGLSSDVPAKLQYRQASVLVNLHPQGQDATTPEKLVVRKGSAPLHAALSPNQDFDGLEGCQIEGSQYLVGALGGSLVNGFTGTTFTGGSGRNTSGRDVNGAFLRNRILLGDGLNQNVVFTGSRIYQAMSEQPVGGITLSDGGAGTLPAGSYSYKITFMNWEGTHGEPSAATSGVTIGGSRQISLTGVPTSLDPDCTGRGIWRKLQGIDSTWKLVGTIANNTATTYTDNTATAGAAIREGDLTRFPPCQLIEQIGNRIYGARCSSPSGDLRTLYVSKLGEEGFCPILPDEDDPTDGYPSGFPDEIVGLRRFGSAAAVFTREESYLFVGDQPGNFQRLDLARIGCAAHRSIRVGRETLLWLAPDGVYSFDGSRTERISDPIREKLAALSPSDLAKANAQVFDDRYYLFFPASGFCYDLRFKVWSELRGVDTRVSAVVPFTSTGRRRLFGARSGTAQTWELETGTTDNETAIETIWESADWNLGVPGERKRVQYVGAAWKREPTTVATLTLSRATGSGIETFTHSLSGIRYAGYPTTLTGQAIDQAATISRMLLGAGPEADDEYFRLRIEAAVSQPYQLLQVDLHWVPV